MMAASWCLGFPMCAALEGWCILRRTRGAGSRIHVKHMQCHSSSCERDALIPDLNHNPAQL